jgi:HTH-type transcriptional regulator/antitoxin HigA
MADSPQLFDMRPVHPGKILRQMMATKSWTQDELSVITGISRQSIYMILSGKSNISAETAARLAQAFGNTLEEWVKWDGLYRASLMEDDLSGIGRLARLYDFAPIRDMQKRGWINEAMDVEELEMELKKFFASESLDENTSFPVATRRTLREMKLNAAEKAWCYRARQLAGALPAGGFNPKRLDQAEKKLRQLAAFRKLAKHVPEVLSEYGIRFVVVEPIPSVKIDGAAFWLEDEPVIAMSIRHDRIDGFWFTLMHEFAHIRHGDASVDSDLIDGTKGIIQSAALVEDEAERIANEAASSSLVPSDELQSFIRRVGPLYARERIVQFAHKVKIHPGIVVGQLQNRNEIGYSALRDLLVKIREVVISAALTDGWNQSVAPAIL